jgi:hypothetical protein
VSATKESVAMAELSVLHPTVLMSIGLGLSPPIRNAVLYSSAKVLFDCANQSLANGGHALLVNACLVLPAMPSE